VILATGALVGYDAGNGRNRQVLPRSCTPAIISVGNESNVNVPGKYLFRAQDSSAPVDVGCENNGSGSDFCLTPNSVDIIGHRPITITGIRLNATQQAFCRFIDARENETEVEVPAEVSLGH
jgi:hypothetical protein